MLWVWVAAGTGRKLQARGDSRRWRRMVPMSGPTLLEQLLRVGPHAGSHRVEVRASVSVAVPLLVLWSVGHLEWAIYAAFGAFTSLYGRNHVHLSRFQMQVTLGLVLTSSVLVGVAVGLSPHRDWLAVPVAAVAAGIASLLSDAQDWHPPGPLFVIFALAACASIPSRPVDLGIAALVAGSSAAFAVVVGGLGATWRVRRRPASAVRTQLTRVSMALIAPRHAARCVASCGVAGALATASGIGHPYWAMVSAMVPLAHQDFRGQVVRGLQRVVGTAAGLALAAMLLAADLSGLALILVVVVLQAGAELWVGRNYAIALISVTPLALLMVHLVSPVPTGPLLFDRGVETVIGVIVGVAVGWLTRTPHRHSPVAT